MNKGNEVKNLKLVAIGDGAVGKTSLLMVFNHQPFPERYCPTVFENYVQESTVDSTVYRLHMWDTAGQAEFDRLRPLAYSDADIILLCFSLTDRNSFDNVPAKWIKEIDYYCKNAKVLLIGTKMDLRSDTDREHITDSEAHSLAKKLGFYGYFPCCAKTGQGVDQLFDQAVMSMKPKRLSIPCLLL